MRVVIVGCGRVGAELALALQEKGHDVTVVDHQASSFGNLHPDFRGRRMQGDALSKDTLQRAGLDGADGLAAVTNSDTVNAVVAQVAREVYRVPRVVVRNYETRWVPMHEAFGVPVVSSTIWGAQRIEEILDQSVLRAVAAPPGGEAGLYELTIPRGWRGKRVLDLGREEGLRVALLTRGGRASIPGPDAPLRAGDLVHLSASAEAADAIRRRFAQEDVDRCSS